MTPSDRTTTDGSRPAPGDAVGISLDGLTKVFAGASQPAVTSLSLDIPPAGIVALVGPSGCGKTTTLKMINRLIEPTEGGIAVGGVDVASMPTHELRRGIGYVIQQTGLFPHLTIEGNIGTVPRLLGWQKNRIRDRVGELVDLVGLDHDMLPRYPTELSGGQQQRVGVARALAADPPVLLMDEPYSAVDPIVRAHLQDELLDLQSRLHKTIVVVTHDIDEAIKLSDRVAILNSGGVLEQYDPPSELLARPVNDFVASFLGEDRALKRLALLTVADIELADGPIVSSEATVGDARRAMDAFSTDWVGVLTGDRIEGWVGRDDLDHHRLVGEAGTRPFSAVIGDRTSLRQALEGIVRSRTRVAVVVDDDQRFRGLVTIDQLADGVAS